jgi:hypothetical protein
MLKAKKIIKNLSFVALLSVIFAQLHASSLEIIRLKNNPVIRPEMLPGKDGANINGPCLIKVPTWVKNPLGKYYLYFAHHSGTYIRLAYANSIEGPWTVYAPGTLKLSEAPGCKGHIASPDVVIDEKTKEFRMYFHGPSKKVDGQKTYLAISQDGIHFKASDEILGIFYWRVVPDDQGWFAMGKGGQMYRSHTGLTVFEEGRNPFPESIGRTKEANSPGPRHLALEPVTGGLWVYYTNIGDAPERILRVFINTQGDWNTWKTTKPEEVLQPEKPYEGVDLPIIHSLAGETKVREHAVRDPAIYKENGHRYLVYSVAGESGIAIAELIDK